MHPAFRIFFVFFKWLKVHLMTPRIKLVVRPATREYCFTFFFIEFLNINFEHIRPEDREFAVFGFCSYDAGSYGFTMIGQTLTLKISERCYSLNLIDDLLMKVEEKTPHRPIITYRYTDGNISFYPFDSYQRFRLIPYLSFNYSPMMAIAEVPSSFKVLRHQITMKGLVDCGWPPNEASYEKSDVYAQVSKFERGMSVILDPALKERMSL